MKTMHTEHYTTLYMLQLLIAILSQIKKIDRALSSFHMELL